MIGLLRKLSSGSTLAFRTLYELNTGYRLKEIISTYDISHSVSSTNPITACSNQVRVFSFFKITLSFILKHRDSFSLFKIVISQSIYLWKECNDSDFNFGDENQFTTQVHEVLKLVIELLPASPVDDNQLALEKESFLVDQPNLLQQFGADMLPVMTQVIS